MTECDESHTCDVTVCAQPAVQCIVGEAGDFWLCAAHMKRCDAPLIVHDDRWGAFTNHCELIDGHQGEHSVRYSGCEPVAYMRWSS